MIKETFKRIFHRCKNNRREIGEEPFVTEGQFFRYFRTQSVRECQVCGDIHKEIDWKILKSEAKDGGER